MLMRQQTIDTPSSAGYLSPDVFPVIREKDDALPYCTADLESLQTVESTGILLIDALETDRILYYRTAGYELPEWQHSDGLWGWQFPLQA